MRRWAIIAFACLPFAAFSQNDDSDRSQIIEQRIEQIAEAIESDNIDYTTLFEQLTVYLDFPLNMNQAEAEELYGLAFLSNYQIEQFLIYREEYGSLFSIYELPQIDGWDRATAELIQPFVQFKTSQKYEKITFSNLEKYGKNELVLRWSALSETPIGYQPISDEELIDNPNARYLGSKDRLYARYRYRYGDRVSFGVTAEKDSGEEFFQGSQKSGFDFYSAHFFLKDFGKLKKLAVGDYQAQFGQGLTFWSGLGFARKSSFTVSTGQAAPGIGPYTSINENLFLRGAATTIGLENWRISAFYSGKHIDGNLSRDTIPDENAVIVSSFQESGFHRTPSEIEDKDAIFQEHFGGNLGFKKGRLHLGLTGVYMRLDGELNLNTDTYSQYRFSGSENWAAGIDYRWKYRNLLMYGETTRSGNGAIATLNGLNINLDPRLILNITQRHYDRDFQGVASIGFGEGSRVENESGVYLGIELRPFKRWKLNAYFDQFKFPWLRYQVDAPSHGQDFLGQLEYNPTGRINFYVRFRKKTKEINSRNAESGVAKLVNEERQNLRFNLSYRTTARWRFRSRVEFTNYKRGYEPNSKGFMVYQDVIYDFKFIPARISLRYALFDTDSYDSRVYAYENDVLYYFSIPAYSGRGSRIYALLKVDISRNIDLWLRWGQFYYTDRNEIGSGRDAIEGNTKTEFKAQMRLKF